MFRQVLQDMEETMNTARTLMSQICDCSDEVSDQPTDEHEWRSGLRYHVAEPVTGELRLASEWVRLLELRLDYASLAPPNVQQELRHIQEIERKTKRGTTHPSLVAWIKQRIEDDKKF
jgi:hypothetical protein